MYSHGAHCAGYYAGSGERSIGRFGMKNLFANFEDFDAAPRLNSLLIQRLGMCPTHTTLERSGISATATATTEGDRVNREKERKEGYWSEDWTDLDSSDPAARPFGITGPAGSPSRRHTLSLIVELGYPWDRGLIASAWITPSCLSMDKSTNMKPRIPGTSRTFTPKRRYMPISSNSGVRRHPPSSPCL